MLNNRSDDRTMSRAALDAEEAGGGGLGPKELLQTRSKCLKSLHINPHR